MQQRILLDENLPFAFIQFFEQRECTVFHIKKLGKSGIRNGEVYKLAEELDAWLITRDSDFQNLEKFLRSNVNGIILLKQEDHRTPILLQTMKQLLEKESTLFSSSQLVTVDEGEVRILKRETKT
jgi:predicted nuclease of predicted toxin-antitoxin system